MLKHPRSRAETVRPTLVTYVLLTAVVGVPAVLLAAPYLVSVASGVILAVLCSPVYARLRRWFSPVWAGLAVTTGAVLVVLLPLGLVVFAGIQQASTLLLKLQGAEAPTARELAELCQKWIPVSASLGTVEELTALFASGLLALVEAASAVVFANVQLLPSMVLQIAIVVLSTYFMLVDGRALFRWVSGKVPLSRQITVALMTSFRGATNAVVLASVAAAGAQALCILGAFAALSVPGAFLAAAVAFVLAWVPTFGTIPVWGGAAIWLMAQGSPARAAAMVIAGLVIGAVDNVVRPLVLRGRKEMHPLVSLLAILGGLAEFGVPGAFIGPLMASLAISVLDIWPAVASYCGIAVSGSGDEVPDVPLAPP